MKEESLIFRTALSVNVLTVNVLLSVFFLSGVLAGCENENAALFISAPKKIEALSGSCLQISCSLLIAEQDTEFDTSREIFGVWIKTDPSFKSDLNRVVFNSSKLKNIYPIKITGNLRDKDCTTLFSNLTKRHTNMYFFRIENGPFKATASCNGVNITVKDSPWKPRIDKPKHLKENESVTITCSVVTSCPHLPPELTWNLQQDSPTQIKKNKNGTFTAEIQKNITLSDSHDGYKIICSVRYPVNEGKDFKTAETEKTLRVSYAPKNTSASISPAGLVSAGTRVNLTCSSRASPPINFSWFKKTLHGDEKVAEGDFYILNETDGGVYYCVAVNDLGNQTSPDVHLMITDVSQHKAKVFIILGGSAVLFVVGLLVCVWMMKKHQTQQRMRKQTDESLQTAASNGRGEVLYEEMNLFNQKPEPSSVSVQDTRQDQDKDLEPENLSTQTAHDPETFYTKVNKPRKQIPASNTEEEFLYEDKNLFKQRPETSSVSVQDSRQDQDKDLEPENVSTQTQSDNVYVQMKKITPSFNSLTTTTTLCSGTGNSSCSSSDEEHLY